MNFRAKNAINPRCRLPTNKIVLQPKKRKNSFCNLYLGRKWFQEAGRNLIVAAQSSRGQIQGSGFGNIVSIPSEGRESTIEYHPIGHSRDTFGRITIPENEIKIRISYLIIFYKNSPAHSQISGRILHYRNTRRNLGQWISFGSKLSACYTNHFSRRRRATTWRGQWQKSNWGIRIPSGPFIKQVTQPICLASSHHKRAE